MDPLRPIPAHHAVDVYPSSDSDSKNGNETYSIFYPNLSGVKVEPGHGHGSEEQFDFEGDEDDNEALMNPLEIMESSMVGGDDEDDNGDPIWYPYQNGQGQGHQDQGSLDSGVGAPVPVYKEDGIENFREAFNILATACDEPSQKITCLPPRNPILDGQVYLYSLREGQEPYEWRNDGLYWLSLRSNSFPWKKPKSPGSYFLTRHDFRLVENGKVVDFHKHEYHEHGKKLWDSISLDEWKYPFILIHYFGTHIINGKAASVNQIKIARKSISGGKKRIFVTYPSEKTTSTSNAKRICTKEETTNYNQNQKHLQTRSNGNVDVNITKAYAPAPAPSKVVRKVIVKPGVISNGNQRTGSSSSTSTRTRSSRNHHEIVNPSPIPNINVQEQEKVLFAPPNAVSLKIHIQPDDPPESESTSLQEISRDDFYSCYLLQRAFKTKLIHKLDFTHGTRIIIAEEQILIHINLFLKSNVLEDGKRLTLIYKTTSKVSNFNISTFGIHHPLFAGEPHIPLIFYLHEHNTKPNHSVLLSHIKELIPLHEFKNRKFGLLLSPESRVLHAAQEEFRDWSNVTLIPDQSVANRTTFKLDSVLSEVVKCEGFDHISMIHLIYFLQCYYVHESVDAIFGGLPNTGLKLRDIRHPKFLGDIVFPRLKTVEAVEEDSVSPSEIAGILIGNLTILVDNASDYANCSESELRRLEGLANFFVARGRVDLEKKRSEFTVKGLGGVNYTVKLSDRSCTCLRKKACEHIFAVMIATGLLPRKPIQVSC